VKRLLHTENIGGRVEKWWLHTDAQGKDVITVETIQDVEPVFAHVKAMTDAHRTKSDFRFKASIPATLIEEVCRLKAIDWGCKTVDVFKELMSAKTDRAKGIWDMLTGDREYRRLQRT